MQAIETTELEPGPRIDPGIERGVWHAATTRDHWIDVEIMVAPSGRFAFVRGASGARTEYTKVWVVEEVTQARGILTVTGRDKHKTTQGAPIQVPADAAADHPWPAPPEVKTKGESTGVSYELTPGRTYREREILPSQEPLSRPWSRSRSRSRSSKVSNSMHRDTVDRHRTPGWTDKYRSEQRAFDVLEQLPALQPGHLRYEAGAVERRKDFVRTHRKVSASVCAHIHADTDELLSVAISHDGPTARWSYRLRGI